METIISARKHGNGQRFFLNKDICDYFQIKDEDFVRIDVVQVIKNPLPKGEVDKK